MHRSLGSSKYQMFKVLVIVLCISQIAICQFTNREIKGEILIEDNSEFYTFKAAVINKTPTAINLKYEYSFFRSDPKTNEVIKTSKKDFFLINSYEKKVVSSVTVNHNIEDKIILLLVIYDKDNKPLGSDRIVLEQGGKTQINLEKNSDYVFLEGVISQKTLTKSGRDFFRDFSQRYYNAQIKSPKNIFVKEVPGRRRNTLITVEVEGQVVWRFFAQPRKEFIKSMAATSIARVTSYLQRVQQQENQIIRY